MMFSLDWGWWLGTGGSHGAAPHTRAPAPRGEKPGAWRKGGAWRLGLWLARSASVGDAALLGDAAHLLGGQGPAGRVTKTGGKEVVDQPGHGAAQAPAFMVEGADDGAVDAGRVVGSPGHGDGGSEGLLGLASSSSYNTGDGAVAGGSQILARRAILLRQLMKLRRAKVRRSRRLQACGQIVCLCVKPGDEELAQEQKRDGGVVEGWVQIRVNGVCGGRQWNDQADERPPIERIKYGNNR